MTSSDFVDVKPFRVLVAGYINLNVIDGSAFFLAGVSAMCARYPGVEVTLVAANPLRNLEVVNEVLALPNVTIVDPYDHPVGTVVEAHGGNMGRDAYGRVLAALDETKPFDAILVRDNESARYLVEARPSCAERTTVYVTGVRHVGEALSTAVRSDLEALDASGASFCVQTPTMREALAAQGMEGIARRCFILPPHVPDPGGEFQDVHRARTSPARLVYTGKFVTDWIPDRILAGFKAATSVRSELRLDVAGDQYRANPDDPHFVDNVRYLLGSSPRIKWHGRLPRAKARDLIRDADLGISWRSPALDSSTELSTKVLEYGALGKAVIVNRTPMHEAMLGADYAYFANSSTDYRRLLLELPESADVLGASARRCFEASRPHWYSSVAPGLLEALGCKRSLTGVSQAYGDLVQTDPDGGLVRPVVRGPWVDLEPDPEGVTSAEALARVQVLRQWHEAARRELQTLEPVIVKVPAQVPAADPKELAAALQEVALLSRKLEATREQRDQARRQLDNLRNSKLGTVQRKVWEVRGRGSHGSA